MKQYINKLENLHIGISGTCLAFITLSNSWMIKDIVYLKPIAITIAIIMLSLILIRLIKFPKVMLNELKDPVLGTFYPLDIPLFQEEKAVEPLLQSLME